MAVSLMIGVPELPADLQGLIDSAQATAERIKNHPDRPAALCALGILQAQISAVTCEPLIQMGAMALRSEGRLKIRGEA